MENETEEITVKPEFVQIEVKVEPFIVESNTDTQNIKDADESDSDEPEDDSAVKVNSKGKRNRVPCPKCDRTLKNQANLKQHLRTVHLEGAETAECSQCFRVFKSKGYLWKHIHVVHRNDKEVNCKDCGKVFRNKGRLDNHVYYTHRDVTPIPCPHCDKVCNGQRKLKLHIRNMHTIQDNIQCPHCDKIFRSELLLKKHIIYTHATDDIEYKCPCDLIFMSYKQYKNHMNNVHPVRQPRCLICHKSYKTPAIAKKHLLVCHNIPEDDLNNHITYNDLPELINNLECSTCAICFKTFSNKVLFLRHMRTTHPPKEAEQACDVCQKTFKSAFHVGVHKYAVHYTKGKQTCDICGREFASKRYLSRHKLTHVVHNSALCNICEGIYQSEAHLRIHIRRIHGKTIIGI
ncbi:zinc finger protein 888-like [Colias croceus]|uniref:zinc finger protein 888-like n=1 Tax=Colias crocea TaxID=72248 RepID=UPI001E27D8C3|nr:zinc finger protein 888-like [Colias croceus]